MVRHMDDTALLQTFAPVLGTPANTVQINAAYAAALAVALKDEPIAAKARAWLSSGDSLNPELRWFSDQRRRLEAADWRG